MQVDASRVWKGNHYVSWVIQMLVSLALASVIAGPSDTPTYHCPHASAPVKMDGAIGDPAWERAPEVSFVRSQDGGVVSRPTSARMCWDSDRLYVAWSCADSEIRATMTRRDDPIYNEDCAEFFVCPAGDTRRYFEINVSPRNVVFDSLIEFDDSAGEERRGLVEWDCKGLVTAARIAPELNGGRLVTPAWTAEMAIPFAALGVSTPKPGDGWKANLYRITRSTTPPEFQAWSPTLVDPAAFHRPRRFGTIIFEP